MFWRTHAAIGTLIVCAGIGSPAQRADVASLLMAESARLAKSSEALGSPAEGVAAGLPRVNQALARRRLLFALDEIQELWTSESAMSWASAHRTIKTPQQFSAEWKRVGEPEWREAAADLPAAVEAIAASNASRAPATWRASLPYSEDAGMDAGLYYLGEAQAFAGFAAFCRALPFESRGRAPALKPLGAEITALESQVADMYDKAPEDAKSRFIRVSVALKIAHTLDRHRDYGAALYQYLTALYRAKAAVAAGTAQGDVEARVDAARAKLTPGEDHSIAEMFLERAAFLMETKDPSAARSAGIIADTIIPAYLKLVQR